MEPFNESQSFNQWWLKAILFIPLFEGVAFMLSDYQNKGEIQSDSLIFLGIVVLIVGFVFMCKLVVSIDEAGVSYRFWPIQLKGKRIDWSNIEKAYIRTYQPLWEYGGWGIRWTFKNGKAYNIKGNIGLQLELKNGKRILIGTGEQQKLESYLQNIKLKHSITAIQ